MQSSPQPAEKTSSPLRAWGTGAVFLLCAVAILYGRSSQLRADFNAQTFLLLAGTVLGLLWLLKRGVRDRAGLPRTGLELPLLLFLVGCALSVAFSPAPRLALEGLSWFFFCAVLFYALVDLLGSAQNRAALRPVLVVATLPTLFFALAEVYRMYLDWWERVGAAVMPPYPFRFISLMGHSNIYMAVMDLVAPFALVLFLKSRSRGSRVLAAFWLVMFAFSVPFSSSRAGWLGMAVAFGVLSAWFLADQARWKKALRVFRQKAIWMAPAGLALLAAGGLAALRFYQVFAGSHPSHGSGGLNRESIWGAALTAWQSSPLSGVGIGRLGLEMFEINRNFPSGWWPLHAHSTSLQILSETGLLGLIPLVLLAVAAGRVIVQGYQRTAPEERPWFAAGLAALTSAGVQSFFDDFTTFNAVLALLVAVVALLITSAGEPARFPSRSLLGLVVPVLGLAAVTAFNLWGYAPLYREVSRETVENWRQAAVAAEESARRDPYLPVYKGQVGLAYAQVWRESGSQDDLDKARQYLSRSLEMDPSFSPYWASLAVLNWQAGEADAAITAIQKAIDLCPDEANFHINLGYMLEQTGDNRAASEQYQIALDLQPWFSNHPFWTGSPMRAGFIQQARITFPPGTYLWEQAREAIAAGRIPEARWHLALSGLASEPSVARAVTMADLVSPDDLSSRKEVVEQLDRLYWGYAESNYYSYYYSRLGYDFAYVPGYIEIHPDVGQFELLEDLFERQRQAGDCEGAARTWATLQRERTGGEIPAGGWPPMPACTGDQQAGG